MLAFLAAGVIAGAVLGLFGAGGTIVALPILLFAAHLGPHLAIGTNALGVAAVAAVLLAWRAVRGEPGLRDGALFAAPGLLGIAVGGQIGLAFSGGKLVFLLGFVVLVVAGWTAYLAWRMPEESGAAMRVRDNRRDGARLTGPRVTKLGATAVAVGGMAGFFGVGGGFLVVPGLAWAGSLDLRHAARVGLVPITAFASLIGIEYLAAGSVDLGGAALVLLGGVAGGAAGVSLADRVPGRAFRFAFATFLVGIAALMIVR